MQLKCRRLERCNIDLENARHRKFLEMLAKKMGDTWQAIGEGLGIPKDYLVNIKWNYYNRKVHEAKAMQVLLTWVENCKERPSVANVKYAIENAKERDSKGLYNDFNVLNHTVTTSFPFCQSSVKAELTVSSLLFVFSCWVSFCSLSVLLILSPLPHIPSPLYAVSSG